MAEKRGKNDKVPQPKQAAEKDSVGRSSEEIFVNITIPDLPPLELPPLELPPLPELNLEALEQAANQPPPPRRKTEYGSGNKDAGPISFEQMLKLKPPVQMMSLGGPSEMPAFPIDQSILQVPSPVAEKELDAKPSVQPLPHVEPRDIITAVQEDKNQENNRAQKGLKPLGKMPVRTQKQPAGVEQPPAGLQKPTATPIRKPAPPSKPERPSTTPLVFSQPPMPPLKERVLEFEEDEATPIRPGEKVRVNLQEGYISAEGIEQPIEADLQMALLKLKEFFSAEFDLGRLQQLRQQVRGLAAAQKPSGELLKTVIAPVLKLGARRYAVINDLLLVKERLSLLEQSVTAALLEEVLSG